MTPSLYAEPDVLSRLDFIPFEEPDKNLIGLHAYAQSGKDTVAAFLVDQYRYEQVVLAKPILDALVRLNPIVQSNRYGVFFRFAEVLEDEGYEEAKKTPEFRRLMQVFGSEVGRELLGETVWLDIADRKMAQSMNSKFVISDVRFRNEADFVRQRGGTLIKIVRPGYGPINAHQSDAGLPDEIFDYVIYNSGTIADLHTQVREVLG